MFETLREAKKTTTGKQFRQLHAEMKEAVADLKRCEASVIQKLQEIDQHLVHRYMGYNSLFQYAVVALGLTEAQSYAYIAVARKAEQYPLLQQAIESGELTVSKAVRITSVIDDRNQEKWIGLAMTSSKRELEKEVAKVNPRLVQPERVRFVSENTLELQLPISEEIYALLERAKELESQRRSAVATTEETLKEVLEFFLDRKDPVRKALSRVKKETQSKGHGKERSKGNANPIAYTTAHSKERKRPLVQVQYGPFDDEMPSSRTADGCQHEDQPSLSGFSLSHPSESDQKFGERFHSSSDLNADANSARAKNPEENRSPDFRARGPDGREPGPAMDTQIKSTPGSAEQRREPVAKDRAKPNFLPGQVSSDIHMRSCPRVESSLESCEAVPSPRVGNRKRVALDAGTLHQLNLRDQGRCRIVLPDGTTCGESRWTEIHHVVEVWRGGTNDLDNLITVCHGHHQAIHQRSVHH